MMPQLDKERSVYNLKEQALASTIGHALGLQRKESPDFIALVRKKNTNGRGAEWAREKETKEKTARPQI